MRLLPDEETRKALGQLCHGSAVEVMRKFFTDPDKHPTIMGSLSASAIDGTHYGPFLKRQRAVYVLPLLCRRHL